MHQLWLEPAIPLASSIALLVFGDRWPSRTVAWAGTGSIGAACGIAIWAAAGFLRSGAVPYTDVAWNWITVAGLRAPIGFYLDPLAVAMTLVVTFISFWIHLYSTEFMLHGEGYSRFFGYMNLFVASMLILVLADNLLLLFLGWEGVGLCSYLLIGFWYTDANNGAAGRKAFVVTRVGDTAMILGLALLFTQLGTLNIQQLLARTVAAWPLAAGHGAPMATLACLLLLGGAVGKSAQLPLQTWLPDAMAGPTPTSALIHAATMVTAGVYLIARMHSLFELSPAALDAVAAIGLATLLLAGCAALAQTDIKRILAYSTISQIGYMFLALGVGAWSAAIFHLVTHACFKALLFLASGVVIQGANDEHDIFKMGGLRQRMPLAFWSFVFAGGSLAGLPLVSAGFYSKGAIVWSAWANPRGSGLLWAGALLGALLTALYIFRLIFIVFYGPFGEATRRLKEGRIDGPGLRISWPLAVLGYLSMMIGFIDLAPGMGGKAALSRFLALPMPAAVSVGMRSEAVSEGVAAAVFFIGLYLAFVSHLQNRALTGRLMASPFNQGLWRFWHSDWGMDWLYDRVFVTPITTAARLDRGDYVDRIYSGIAWGGRLFHGWLSRSETGRLRWYTAWIAGGAVALVLLAWVT